MADEPVANRLDEQHDEDEGGPIKSFLEHLEDLRWVLIKSAVAAGVAMLVCLLAGPYAIRVLTWPLDHAPVRAPKSQTLRVLFGTNQLAMYHITGTNDPLSAFVGTNQATTLNLVPAAIGDHQVLTAVTQSDPQGSPVERLRVDLVNMSPAGSFIVATKVAFFGGLVISAPLILSFIAQFVFPALRMREKKYIHIALFVGSGLFLTGLCFCYFILLPIALTASVQYAEWLGFSAYQWRAEDYISFVCKFMFGMGVGFELPVVVLTLVKIGVLNYSMLARGRRYVIIISAVLGAILTTPEVVTQVLMAVPLYLLYEITIWIAWYWERQEKKREALEQAQS